MQYYLYGAWEMKYKFYASMEKFKKSPQNLTFSIISAWHVYSANLYQRPLFLNIL